MSGRVKVTLSLRGDLVRRVRSRLALEGRSLSDLVEELLETYDSEGLLDELCDELGLERRFYADAEVKSGRPRGLRAEDVVGEVRHGRGERVSGHERHS